jgi:hypothetical protein
VPRRLTITRSFSSVPAGAASARFTAARTAAIAPMRAGATACVWRGTLSTSGRAKDAVTAWNASASVKLPTSTPEIVTPVAISVGAVVVVPVVVVPATTPADRAPAASRPSTKRSAKAVLRIASRV